MRPFLARACVVLGLTLSFGGCGKKETPGAAGAAASAPGAAVAAPSGLAFLDGFEGEIGVLVKDASPGAKPVPPFALKVKEGKVRVEIPEEMAASKGVGGKGYAVLNAPEKKLFIVIDDKKQVVLFDLDKAGEQLKAFGGGMDPAARGARDRKEPTSEPPPKVTKTGLKDTVAGYTCELWDVVSQDGDKLRACVANEGASWFRLPLTGIPTEHAWALELLDGKHFPLSGIAYDKSGAEKGRVEVTKIDKKTLAANVFEIPPGYKVVDLQQMMMGFAAMGGGAMGAAAMMGKMPPGFPPGMIPPGAAAGKGAPPRGAPPAPPAPKRP